MYLRWRLRMREWRDVDMACMSHPRMVCSLGLWLSIAPRCGEAFHSSASRTWFSYHISIIAGGAPLGRSVGVGIFGVGPRIGVPAESLCTVFVSVCTPSSNIRVYCSHSSWSPLSACMLLLSVSASFWLLGPCLISRWVRSALYLFSLHWLASCSASITRVRSVLIADETCMSCLLYTSDAADE